MDKINKNLVLTIIIIIFLVSIISGCEDNIGGEAIESNSDTKDSKLNPKLEGITSEEKIISDTSKEQEKIVLNNEMRIPTTKEIKFPLNKNDRDMVITLEGIPGTWIGIVSPVLYDLDDDGDQELIVQTQESDNSKLYIISYEGEIIHEVFLDCFINPRSFPSIADINNDNLPEIVVFCYDGPNEQSQFKILNNEGILIDTWNVEYGISDDLYSSINLLDLNNDGTTEIIYGGYNGYESALVVLDNEGEVMNGFPITLEGIDSSEAMTPAIGNLNNDSNKEIVAISRNDGVDSMWLTEDDESYIRAYNINGEELWNQTIIGDRIGSDPVIADINNNGDNEIIFSSSKGLRVLNNQGDYD